MYLGVGMSTAFYFFQGNSIIMKESFFRIFGIWGMLLILMLSSCRDDSQELPSSVENVKKVNLFISVPEKDSTRSVGDPGVGVDESDVWDRMDVILAYSDDSQVIFPDNSKVQIISLSREEFSALPSYNGNSRIKQLGLNARPGLLYIFGVTYNKGVYGNPKEDIAQCRTLDDVQNLTITNDYSKAKDANDDPLAGTENIAQFLSVATGYYQTEGSDQPAALEIKEGDDGSLVTSYPVIRLKRLATKIDIQWDAADAYEKGYTNVRVKEFSYNGTERGALFPAVKDKDFSVTGRQWNFYNTAEISQRNGRVYHYSFSDGKTIAQLTFRIMAQDNQNNQKDLKYSLNFDAPLQQAAWYKVNVQVRGLSVDKNISLSTGE